MWAFLQGEWRLWTLVVPLVLTGWLGHDYTHYVKYESLAAKFNQQMTMAHAEAEKKAAENEAARKVVEAPDDGQTSREERSGGGGVDDK